MVAVASQALAMTADRNPWIDGERFAARRYLGSLRRETTPVSETTPLGSGLAQQVGRDWAEQLRWADGQAVTADELVLCGSAREALALALGGLLAPGDSVLVARPAATDALATVLGRGGQFVDVGRCHDGAIDPAAVARAAQRHPAAVAYVEAPSLLADDDLAAWPTAALRACVADLRQAGWPTALPTADAVLLALRDPDQPAPPVLWAVAAPAAIAGTLGAIGGAAEFAEGVLARAAALLRGLAADRDWAAGACARLQARAQPLRALAASHPGARLHAAGPLRVAAACAAGDATVLAGRFRALTVAVAAYGDHPMRHLVVADLTASGP